MKRKPVEDRENAFRILNPRCSGICERYKLRFENVIMKKKGNWRTA
jgi:hypothetical protein